MFVLRKLSTNMTKTILCTIDFSDSSKHALTWAINIAHKLNAPLTILYTYRLYSVKNSEAVELKKQLESKAQDNFHLLEKDLLEGRGIQYDFKTEVGFVTDRVENYVRNNSIGFLVMDKSMNFQNKEIFNELVDHIRIPLVIVP